MTSFKDVVTAVCIALAARKFNIWKVVTDIAFAAFNESNVSINNMHRVPDKQYQKPGAIF